MPESKPQREPELVRLIAESRRAQHEANRCAQALRDYHKARSETHPERYVRVKIR